MYYNKFEIYQIRNNTKSAYVFAGWKFAKSHGFNFSDYNKVYEGTTHTSSSSVILENLFSRFNVDRPDNFTGHSLSVSDIVVLTDTSGSNSAYYCDIFSWEPIDVLQ